MRAFSRFTWFVVAYQLAVIAWGALVRATGSGAGCGEHWPLCNGQVLPRAPSSEMLVEFAHRATSGLALLLVVAVFVWARRAVPRGHAARRAAGLALLFIVIEALLGAALVLFGWVAKDASAGRGWAMSLHLANTFLLLATLSLAAAWSGDRPARRLAAPGTLPLLVAAGLVAMMLAGVSGAVAALGDTLYPATSFAEGLRHELSGGAALLLRLRLVHPFAAIVAAVAALAVAWSAAQVRPEPHVRRLAAGLGAVVAVQFVAGIANVLLLAPVWLQLVHLVLADLLWIGLVVVGAWSLAPHGEAVPGASQPLAPAPARAR